MPKNYELSDQQKTVYEELKKVRASKTVAIKPTQRLKTEILGLDGEPQPLKLRYYQVQGIYHLLRMKRMILGDDTGIGKTLQAIGALCYLWDTPSESGNKVIVIAPKSAVRQWASEIDRFTNGVKTIIIETPKNAKAGQGIEARKAAYREWLEAPTGPNDPKVVMVINYALLIKDWNEGGIQPLLPNGKPDPKQAVLPGLLDATTAKVAQNLVVIFDECHAFKSMGTKTWDTARFLSDRAHRVYGLSATILKNRLFEGYCIYKAIKPDLFTSKNAFHEDYCYIELKSMGKAKIPVILGYKNLDHFRDRIDPFFLGRKKHMVSDELPTLTTREYHCELSAAEEAKYKEALSGVLELGDGTVRDFEDNKALVSLLYCQQVVNSLTLLRMKEGDVVGEMVGDGHKVSALGSKEQGLVDLVTGELDDEKVIVYTRFASLVPRLREILKREGIKSVAITGKEDDKARAAAQKAFQDLKSDVRVVFITDAGSAAINLQAAAALIYYDLPWSWGDYIQILGRMVRIGSPHKGVLVFHLVADRPNRRSADAKKTIDHHGLSLLRKKKTLIDKVLGEAAVGALTFESGGNSLQQLIRAMQDDAGVGVSS